MVDVMDCCDGGGLSWRRIVGSVVAGMKMCVEGDPAHGLLFEMKVVGPRE